MTGVQTCALPIYRLDIERETLYPTGLYDSDLDLLYDRYSAAIYARLEEEDVLDPSEALYVGLLQMYNSRRDGYALLKAILTTNGPTRSDTLRICLQP